MKLPPTITDQLRLSSPSFPSESVQNLFLNKATVDAQKIWSGDETTTFVSVYLNFVNPEQINLTLYKWMVGIFFRDWCRCWSAPTTATMSSYNKVVHHNYQNKYDQQNQHQTTNWDGNLHE